MSVRVLVTDGTERSALAIVRSLGRAGHRPYVAAADLPCLASASRHSVETSRVPDPVRDADGFVDAVAELGWRWAIDVLIPSTDAAMSAVLANRERFQHMILPAPPTPTFRRAADRACLLEDARALGIPVPEQQVIRTPAEARELAGSLPYPLALKPSGSGPIENGHGRAPRVEYCATPDELRQVLERFPGAAYPLLAQRVVDGPGLGVFLLVWEGETIASFAHRRIREKPPSGGTSVFRESVAPDPDLLRWSEDLLRRYGWQGVAMVEFKYDHASRTPYLMEVNGRFWGSLQLAIDAGVDFPRLLVELATGSRVPPVRSYRTGVRTRWEWGEVDHLAALLAPGSRTSPGDGAGRLRPLASAIRGWLTPARLEVLRLRDPAPFLVETSQWLKAVSRR